MRALGSVFEFHVFEVLGFSDLKLGCFGDLRRTANRLPTYPNVFEYLFLRFETILVVF